MGKQGEEDEPPCRVTKLTVTNGFDKMFMLELSYAFMRAHRTHLGIEGTWKAYFDLLKQAMSEGANAIKVN